MTRTVCCMGLLLALAAGGLCLAQDATNLSTEIDDTMGSRLDVDLYGYVKLDACYDDGRVANGDFAKWVMPDDGGDVDHFSGTVNQTRLGLRVGSPEGRPFFGRGRVEIDFYGGGDEPDPRIRHAYLELVWPEAGIELLIGQTSDVISPLFPTTLNYTVAWWTGNIGFRRPQIRVTKEFDITDAVALTLEGALTHNVYDTRTGDVTGEDTGLPAFQARASATFPALGARPATLGLSGHHAREDFEMPAATERVDSWSAGLDLALPVSGAVVVLSELWAGSSLAPYLGGIGQGIDLGAMAGIRSRGGWLAVAVTPPASPWRYNAGVAVDDADGDDLVEGCRTRNQSIFANLIRGFGKHVDAGLELSHWQTEYCGRDTENALRAQASLFYKF